MKVLVEIETTDDQGAGTGRPADPEVESQPIRVLGGFAGDLVEARLSAKAKRGPWHAELLRVERPSADRAAHVPCQIWRPDCACPLMPLSDEAQARRKRELVTSAFASAGRSDVVVSNLIAAEAPALSYRSKIVLVARKTREQTIFGGYARGTHYVLDLDGCVIEEVVLRHAAAWTRENMARIEAFDEANQSGELRYVSMRSTGTGEALVTWIGAKEPAWAKDLAQRMMEEVPGVRGVLWAENVAAKNAIWDQAPHVLAGAAHVDETVHDLTFRISPRSFFQVHRAQASALRARMLTEIEAALESPIVGAKVWDLYCGVGVNALFLAKHGAVVTGLESVADSIKDAQENAARNSLTATFAVANLEQPLANLDKPAVVIVNPPRKGAPRALVESIAAAAPKCIIYIACAPGPLAAAAAWLAPLGYVARTVVPFDLFPQTEHVETLAVFVKA